MADGGNTATEEAGWPVQVVAVAIIGVLTGVVVLVLEHAIDDVLEELNEAPTWVPAAALVGGALLTAAITHYLGGRQTATTEVYVEEFHHRIPSTNPRHAPGRLLAAFTSLASGAPLGMEGPAVYTGTATAATLTRRLPRRFRISYHTLLVAGAAAGIAAVFKAPAAGAIFALEVPFRDRFAGERVLPALFGSAAGYLTMAVVDGVEPELEVPLVELTTGRVAVSALLGIAVGVAAFVVIRLVHLAESAHRHGSPAIRALVGGVALVALYVAGRGLTGESIAIASGNSAIDWAIAPDHAVVTLLAVFAIRAVGPAVAIAGGGVGGLFIPLMASGAVIGRLFADAIDTQEVTLYVTVGAACMLGAGYAVPLTGVVFVAEYTGQSTVIVPALVAMAATHLVTNGYSVSSAQRPLAGTGTSHA